jgi:hypothetical protein
MIRTQIQLPNEIYRRARELAEAREISMAELVRRSLELLISQYPEPDKTVKSWQMPKAFDLGWRDLTDEEIKEQAQMSSIESEITLSGKAKKHAKR